MDEALSELRRVAELAPHDPGNHVALANALSAKELKDESQEKMRKAQEERPQWFEPHPKLPLKTLSRFSVLLAVLLGRMFAAAVPPWQAAPDVILITIDTVRADHLGCYGAKDIQTPTLDSLARDGTVFERAVSQVKILSSQQGIQNTGQRAWISDRRETGSYYIIDKE